MHFVGALRKGARARVATEYSDRNQRGVEYSGVVWGGLGFDGSGREGILKGATAHFLSRLTCTLTEKVEYCV